uniref:Uncharacterized protein n=1 Tax=Falco tinnunculus TaxID=100819 RepID=A0A8C4UNG1_FALTI
RGQHCAAAGRGQLLGSSDPAGSASRVAGTTGTRHQTTNQLYFCFTNVHVYRFYISSVRN